ncbi:MAG: hypothetical protein LBF67_01745 [Prevotellaceae bacterium]|jgi:hypothetical protein|nr:hypothetical protein [Prevotellaceae bacterium]
MRYFDENSNNLMDFFQRYPHKIKVIDLKLDITTQMEYFSLLSEVSRKYDDEKFGDDIRTKAFDPGVPLDERKHILVWLSCCEDVEILRDLEQYEKDCPEEIKELVSMCVYQCRTGIESSLLGEHHAVVVSGMGGKDNKIRYFAALSTVSGQPWSQTEQHLLREELMLTSRENDAVIELLEFSGRYAKIQLLTPIMLSPVAIVRSAKDASNELGEFISQQEVITNISRLSDEKLDGIFNGEE